MKHVDKQTVELTPTLHDALKRYVREVYRIVGERTTIKNIVSRALLIFFQLFAYPIRSKIEPPTAQAKIDLNRLHIVWQVDVHGAPIQLGPGWTDKTGSSLPDDPEALVHPDDRDKITLFRRAFDARQPFHCEYKLKRQDGSWARMASHAGPHYSDTGEFLGFTGSAFEVESDLPFLVANDVQAAAHQVMKVQ